MAYVMVALRTVMEWATVPVLAVAMCLPHGALVYWLSSSSVSLAQVRQPPFYSPLPGYWSSAGSALFQICCCSFQFSIRPFLTAFGVLPWKRDCILACRPPS